MRLSQKAALHGRRSFVWWRLVRPRNRECGSQNIHIGEIGPQNPESPFLSIYSMCGARNIRQRTANASSTNCADATIHRTASFDDTPSVRPRAHVGPSVLLRDPLI